MAKNTKKISADNKPLTKLALIKQINQIIEDADRKTAAKLEKLLKQNGYWYTEWTGLCVNDGEVTTDHGGYQLVHDGIMTADDRSYLVTLKQIKKEQCIK